MENSLVKCITELQSLTALGETLAWPPLLTNHLVEDVNLPAGVTVEPRNGVSPFSCSTFHGHPHSLSHACPSLFSSVRVTLFNLSRSLSFLFFFFALSLTSPPLVQARRRSDSKINSRPCDILISQRWGQRQWVILSGISAVPVWNNPLMKL